MITGASIVSKSIIPGRTRCYALGNHKVLPEADRFNQVKSKTGSW
jgi:hypothetical protein